MKAVVLVDGVGHSRDMVVERTPVRVAVAAPLSLTPSEDWTVPSFSAVDFCDSGLVTEDGRSILTPDGKDVPISRYPQKVFRRGRQLWADVWVSDREAHHLKASIDELLWDVAIGHFHSLVPDRASRVVRLGARKSPSDRADGATRYRVFAEEQTPLDRVVRL